MLHRIRTEWAALVETTRRLDRQTVFVLLVSAALVLLQLALGSRRFFRRHIGPTLDLSADWEGLLSWGWWFGFQGITGFVLPVLFLFLLFRRKPSEIGLGLGDWRLAGLLALLYLPVVAAGTWFLSADEAFQLSYPHFRPAVTDWRFFAMYQALFLFYWLGWEYLWRGFVLFGTARTFGVYAIFVQTMPFAILHASKPPEEAFLSIVGAVALGALVWRCRSFWIAVPIHAAQMLLIDLWCTLRLRTGVMGVGLDALMELVGKL